MFLEAVFTKLVSQGRWQANNHGIGAAAVLAAHQGNVTGCVAMTVDKGIDSVCADHGQVAVLYQQFLATLLCQYFRCTLQAGIDTVVFVEREDVDIEFPGELFAGRVATEQENPGDGAAALQGAQAGFDHIEHEVAALFGAQRWREPRFGEFEVFKGYDGPHNEDGGVWG